MNFSYCIKGFLVFAVLILSINIILKAQTPGKYRASQRYHSYMEDQYEWITNILETGASPNSRNESGYTPLIVAVSHVLNSPFIISRSEVNLWTELIMDLLEAGADPTLSLVIKGEEINPLTVATNHLTDPLHIVDQIVYQSTEHEQLVNKIIAALIQARDR